MNIGGRIVLRLEQLNKDRKFLLEKVPDLTPQALSNLIKRDSKRSEWDEQIAEALGVSVLWLVYGREEKVELAGETRANYTLISPHVQAVATAMAALDDSDQVYLRGKVEGWIEGRQAPNFTKRARAS